MRVIGMADGVGGIFSISTASEALPSESSLRWFSANEARLRDGSLPPRRDSACTGCTPLACGRLVADVVRRWVDMPVAEHRVATAPGTDSRVTRRKQRLAGNGEVVFTFGDASWVQRLAAEHAAQISTQRAGGASLSDEECERPRLDAEPLTLRLSASPRAAPAASASAPAGLLYM